MTEDSADLQERWNQFLESPFPEEAATVDGVDLVMLDGAIAGCIEDFLHAGGALGAGRQEMLFSLLQTLSAWLADEPGEPWADYFKELEVLGEAVLRSLRQ